ncbi:hypothetical protein [Mumia zhuanghuii]|uniref:Uncharacterized protein n=1 Tax=Mumia zhuanghuii TaxID=2585211 RepID=A0A5C4MC64_9ACTN|nr:hypothetical protein [Mumia zhuanghuii]TNC31324.1 hypothetical protein FHE65_32155 [Mumia zhuanghuii]
MRATVPLKMGLLHSVALLDRMHRRADPCQLQLRSKMAEVAGSCMLATMPSCGLRKAKRQFPSAMECVVAADLLRLQGERCKERSPQERDALFDPGKDTVEGRRPRG